MYRKRGKWLLSLFLSAELVLGSGVTPALAVTRVEMADKAAASQSVEDYISAASKADAEAGYGTTTGTGISTFSLKTDDLDISTGTVATSLAEESGAEPDLSDPTIGAVSDELDSMEVLADEGGDQKVTLTEDQKTAVLTMYQQYQDQWKANADVLGVQVPFYLQYNDKNDDGLGVLGEMLVLAGVSVDDVRNGNYSYDDLTGMIMNFLYGDKLGVELYGKQIRSQRDAALKAVEDSGAQTEYQKLLVLNDWLATQDTFDMSYIMNSMDSNNPAMVASNPVQPKDYQTVHDTMYKVYEEQLTNQFKGQFKSGAQLDVYKGAIKQTVYDSELKKADVDDNTATQEQKDAATKAAEDYLTANADAISADPKGFVTEKFGAEAAEAIEKQLDEIVNNAMANNKIDADGDGKEDGTANELIPVYAEQAASGMTTGILGYWEGNHIGALCLGTSVCKGYASAYQYLVQCMHPEVYLKEGMTDITVADNWKEASDLYYNAEGKLDPEQNYLVDSVRITFHADVKMYGESQPEFNSDHFWNAVKIDGKWYYVDPCYTDVYSEVMMRDRVETDGYMNHLYFMFSDDTARSLYDGYFTEIKGLYEGVATDKTYENAWFARAKSNVYYGDGNAYYVYDSTNLIKMMGDYDDMQNNQSQDQSSWSELQKPARYKLVAHKLGTDDTGDGDTDYTALIEFNKSDDDDDELGKAYVYNPSTKDMEESDWLTKLYAEHAQMADTYPSIAITTALYEGKLYFNLSKYLLSYDLSTGEVKVVKSYDTVNMVRDDTKAFGGMAFSITDDADSADFTFKNHPIAGICLKGDNLTVSIATNLAYISGKDDVSNRNNPQADESGKKDPSYTADSKDNGYGYEFEETNYNPNYNSYSQDKGSQYGYKNEINDNDEFMFVANGVTTTPMSDVAGSTAEYVEDTHEHHYVESDETFFTKDDNSKWNTGVSYVCTECGKGLTEPIDNSNSMGGTGSDDDYEERKAEYDAAAENAKQGHKYTPSDAAWGDMAEDGTYPLTFQNLACSVCEDVKDQLDCLIGDKTIDVALTDKVTATAERTKVDGSCTDENGVTVTYTASGEAEDKAWTAEKVETIKTDGKHDYQWTFDWAEDGSSATATYTCSRGDVEGASPSVATVTEKTDARVEPTCGKDGSKTLVATVTLSDGTTATDEKKVTIPATGEHSYAEPTEADWKWTEDGTGATLTLKCTNCGETAELKAEVKKDDDKSVDPTYEKEGTYVYNATVTAGDKTYTATKSVTTPKLTVEKQTVYRLYNQWSHEHLFTKDADERDELIGLGWDDEGTAWVGLTYSKTPVYRLFNEYNREHLYTTDEDEKNDLMKLGWSYEKVAFYASDTKTDFPVYREFNPYETNFTHHYTADLDEHKINVKAGWVDEGIKWYAVGLGEDK